MPPWRPLALTPQPGNDAVLAEILDGGQAFRWQRVAASTSSTKSTPSTGSTHWLGQWSTTAAELRLLDGTLQYRTPLALGPAAHDDVRRYFATAVDYPALADRLPFRSDPHLALCLKLYPGLRILRQPFGETLLGFLCSATKRIVQIKQMLALLAERLGAPLAPGLPYRRLPTWPELAEIPEAELRCCLLGFRARHVHRTALFLAANPGWLEETEAADYPAAKARLCELPGVGEKIADCVLLFGAGRLEAFPVDTWILKAMAARYGLHGWKAPQIVRFGQVHFGPLAGLAQQYLFAYERGFAADRTLA